MLLSSKWFRTSPFHGEACGFESRREYKKNFEIMFVIVKFVKNHKGVEMPVIIIDTHNEVLEFETYEEADKLRDLMEANSDSGHRYEVKKI